MGLLGGLALFLYGMDMMSSALKIIAGSGLRKVLGDLTKNRFMAAVTGAFTTAIVQSSSVTTVLMVGFISAGLMTLTQSIGVIMGANIGSTITAQLIAFKITKYALLMIFIGFTMLFLGKKEKLKQTGKAVMGMGLLFFGMGVMSEATSPLREYQPFIDAMTHMSNPLLGILAGMVFTAIVQSSAATTGIVIVLAGSGFITLEAGIALAFGANVGTCVTALLSSIGKPTEAKRAGAVHILFNVIGVLIWLPLIDVLADWIRTISPTYPELAKQERLNKEIPRQIANAHTLFNIVNTLVFIWFDKVFAKMAIKLVPDKPLPLPEAARPQFLDPSLFETPSLATDRVAMETQHLGELVLEIVEAMHMREGVEGDIDIELISERSRDVEILSTQILDYARQLSAGAVSEEDSQRLQDILEVVNQLRGIADSVATNLGSLYREWKERQLEASEETKVMFRKVFGKVQDAIQAALAADAERDREKAKDVIEMKKSLSYELDQLSKHLGKRLLSNDPNRSEIYALESRVLEIIQRLYYFAKRIAKVVNADLAEKPDLTDDTDLDQTTNNTPNMQ